MRIQNWFMWYSDLSVFSLHPVKTIAAGEGGIITTNDKEIYKKLLRLRSMELINLMINL